MKELKVIFLDIDGVLNSRESETKYHELLIKKWGKEDNIPFYEAIGIDNPHIFHIVNLNKIVQKTGAKVVISSTWRKDASNLMWNRFLALCGFRGEVIGKTEWLGTYRGVEIDTWIKCYNDKHHNPPDNSFYRGQLTNFVILDDDSDMEPHMDKLVICKDGLREKEANKAIRILNGKN
jgi:hypothetical protein